MTRNGQTSKRLILSNLGLILLCAVINGCCLTHVATLKNRNLSVHVNSKHGQITEIENHLTGEKWHFDSSEFAIITTEGQIDPSQMKLDGIRRKPDHLTFELSGKGCRVELHYELGDDWVEKWITLRADRPLTLNRIEMGRRRFHPGAFDAIHPHSDNTLYNVPICWFLRKGSGGLYTGIEFPFTDAQMDAGGMCLSYGGRDTEWDPSRRDAIPDTHDGPEDRPMRVKPADMGITIQAGQIFTGEKEFIGVYRNAKNIYKKQLAGTQFYHKIQHDGVPRILTTTPETLDWGEVWAMQKFMRHVLPPVRSITHKGFVYYLNGYWGKLPPEPANSSQIPIYAEVINRLQKNMDVSVIGPMPFWMAMEPFFKRDSKFVRTVGKDGTFHVNEAMQTILDNALARGVTIASASEGKSHYREDRPDWKRVYPADYPANLSKNPGELCWADPAAAEWFYQLHDYVFTHYGKYLKFWCWDGGWLPGEPPSSRIWDCAGKNHGHATINTAYLAFKNVMNIFQRLREKHPEVLLAFCWVAKSGGPWSLKDVYVNENYYENPGPDDLRFQWWYMQNSSFVPPDRNMAQIWFEWKAGYKGGEITRDYRYGLMTALSSGHDFGFLVQQPTFEGINEGERNAKGREYYDFMRRWREWASRNIDVLRQKRDLFGQPLRAGGIDGSAHILGDHGFIFLFNPTQERHIGRIVLDDRIGLDRGWRFLIRQIFPEPGCEVGVYRRNQPILVDLPAGECRLLEITPSKHGQSSKLINSPNGADIQDAFQ